MHISPYSITDGPNGSGGEQLGQLEQLEPRMFGKSTVEQHRDWCRVPSKPDLWRMKAVMMTRGELALASHDWHLPCNSLLTMACKNGLSWLAEAYCTVPLNPRVLGTGPEGKWSI